MKIKLFACDLDGTLFNEHHLADEVVLDAIDQVLKHKRVFSVATGRALHEYERIREFGKRPIYTIAMNGAIIRGLQNEVLYTRPISKNMIEKMLQELPTTYFQFTTKDHTLVQANYDDLLAHLHRVSAPVFFVDKFDAGLHQGFRYECSDEEILSEDILKINCRVENEQEKRILDEFVSDASKFITNAPFEYDFYEMTEATVNKEAAVRYLAEHLGIHEDEVAVYGDGGNDLEMLKGFKHSFAMHNAIDEAKELASELIGYNHEHAVPKHILKLLAIK